VWRCGEIEAGGIQWSQIIKGIHAQTEISWLLRKVKNPTV
jgi:hypothetical protein